MFESLPNEKKRIIMEHPQLGKAFFSGTIDKQTFLGNAHDFEQDLYKAGFTRDEFGKVIKEIEGYPVKRWSGPISVAKGDFYEEMINGIKKLDIKKVLQETWLEADKYRNQRRGGVPISYGILSEFLLPSQKSIDNATNLSGEMRNLGLSIQQKYPKKIEYKEFQTDGPNHEFILNPPTKLANVFFKIYFHAIAMRVPDVVNEIITNSLRENANINFSFKVTDFPYNLYRSCENRIVGYVNKEYISPIVHAIRKINPQYLYDGSHKYGYEICKGVSVIYTEKRAGGELGTNLIETLTTDFDKTKTFEEFFKLIKTDLSRKFLHFKLAFEKY